MKIIKPIDRSVRKADWEKIWQESVSGQLSDLVRETAWERLLDDDVPLFGFIAYQDERTPVGFLHYALHPITGAVEPAAYMQDLFVLPQYRHRGYARALMDALAKHGQAQKWDRVHWVVESDNKGANSLYELFAAKLDFSFFILPIAMLKRMMN